ncbi:MAG: tRNA dimethylallyltransferase 1 [Limisphaerales bacterium]|nr:MAG: tRNA dimethylallyltransferase 1 [Limisphaerales bacterium]KAG0507624.1 MAG: tRNA dimethylallyltransferase 1 [Limisphaerales bacterium]TXT48199.1 MAG: tRNA dimethylallyltransferase 1 [Limisphaerales bacterium]
MNTKPTTSQDRSGKLPCKKSLNFLADDGVKQSPSTAGAKQRGELQPAFRPVVILGPTTVGKAEVAFGLARRLSTEVINADKFYLYDALPEVTGQSDADQYPDVASHLYGVLQPEDSLWSQAKYSSELKACLPGIRSRGRAPIIEGCSNGLIGAALNALNSAAESPEDAPLVIGLRWKHAGNLAADCERRAAKMFSQGMLPSFREACAQRMTETYLLRKCFAREPLLAHQRRTLSRSRCQHRVAELLERHARRHYEMLGRIPNVHWIDHDRQCPETTIERILTVLGQLAR